MGELMVEEMKNRLIDSLLKYAIVTKEEISLTLKTYGDTLETIEKILTTKTGYLPAEWVILTKQWEMEDIILNDLD